MPLIYCVHSYNGTEAAADRRRKPTSRSRNRDAPDALTTAAKITSVSNTTTICHRIWFIEGKSILANGFSFGPVPESAPESVGQVTSPTVDGRAFPHWDEDC